MSHQTLASFFKDDASQLPFFQSFQKEMEQMLDSLRGPEALAPSGAILPALDIAETDDEIEITAEIPGVEEADLDVSVTGDVLMLKGEKNSKHEEKEMDYHLVERRYGSFRRQVPLGFTPDADAVDAVFAGGVLQLKIKKPEATKAAIKKIEIAKK